MIIIQIQLFSSEKSMLPYPDIQTYLLSPQGFCPLIRWGPHHPPCPREFFRFVFRLSLSFLFKIELRFRSVPVVFGDKMMWSGGTLSTIRFLLWPPGAAAVRAASRQADEARNAGADRYDNGRPSTSSPTVTSTSTTPQSVSIAVANWTRPIISFFLSSDSRIKINKKLFTFHET